MPELPEVETVRRSLTSLVGQKLNRVEVPDGRLRYKVTRHNFTHACGQKLASIERHGKYLIFDFGSETIVFHLGMTGRMLLGQEKISHYAKVLFHFARDRLDFIDVRRFGFVLTGARGRDALPVGIDARESIAPAFEKIRKSRSTLKSLLLNQKIIAGLGNIYVCEILFLAKVDPRRIGANVSAAEWRDLVRATGRVLDKAIRAKGSSISDFVYSVPGEKAFAPGGYQNEFLVYGRVGEACQVCGTKIKRIVQSGRSTFFCEVCQR